MFIKLSLPDDWTSTDHQRGNTWRNRSQRSDCWTVDLCKWGSRSFSCHLATNSGTRRRPWGMGGRAWSLCGSSHFERKWGLSYWTLVIFLCCIFHLISTTNYKLTLNLQLDVFLLYLFYLYLYVFSIADLPFISNFHAFAHHSFYNEKSITLYLNL